MAQKRGRLESEGFIPLLPMEITVFILRKIPIKDLIKCTMVRKSWRSMLKDQKFITDYSQSVKNSAVENGTLLLLVHGASITDHPGFDALIPVLESEEYSIHYDNWGFEEHSTIQIPVAPRMWNVCFRVVGVSNGIICLADDLETYGYNFILCNPYIRKSVHLPQPNVTFESHGRYGASVGLGCDAMTTDCKVARIVTLADEFSGTEDRTIVEVYSLATHSWGHPQIVPPCRVMGLSQVVFLDGALYWPAWRRENGTRYRFVLVFDLHTESFRQEIVVPEGVRTSEDVLSLDLALSSDHKSIALCATYQNELVVWVLNGQTWNEVLREIRLIPLHFSSSGELILASDVEENFGLYVSHGANSPPQRKLPVTEYGFYTVDSYDETLMLLNTENATSY